MTTPETGTALLILVAFVLPGFVTLLISERTHVFKDTSNAFERLLLALYYSVLSYGLLALAGWTFGVDREDVEDAYRHEQSIGKILGVSLLAVVIVPFFIATCSRVWLRSGLRKRIIQKARINPSHQTPTAWDHFFEQGEEAMIRATLSDGRIVGGYYGPGSFSTYGERARDLFISQQWELDDDGWFHRPADATAGLWLGSDSIVSFEVYAMRWNEEAGE